MYAPHYFFRGCFGEIVWYIYIIYYILHVYISYIFKYILTFLMFMNLTIHYTVKKDPLCRVLYHDVVELEQWIDLFLYVVR